MLPRAQTSGRLNVLAGGLAHDFNNLLATMIGNAELVADVVEPDSSIGIWTREIQSAGRLAADLTRQLLVYAVGGKPHVEPIPLASIVRSLSDVLGGSVAKNVSFEYHLDDSPAIWGDLTQRRQVVLNLLTNAAEACPDDSTTVLVSTGSMRADREFLSSCIIGQDLPTGEYAFIEITDQGDGMTAATIERIFDGSFSTKSDGRGQGLATTLGILESHQATIRVSSQPDRGSTFRVVFPSLSFAQA